jgi:phosphoglycolate phosphatase
LTTVFFDLDGTLVDTAPDLGYALNTVLRAHGREPLPAAAIRPRVSRGAPGLIELGFGFGLSGSAVESIRIELLAVYAANLLRESRLFPGMDGVLDLLAAHRIPWGVVTNKLAYLTEPLLAGLGLAPRPVCVVSGDSTPRRKPHPEPLLLAARFARAPVADCVYVGDDIRDVEAARAAGMRSVVALYGYLGDGPDPQTWGADRYIAAPADLPSQLAEIGMWIR